VEELRCPYKKQANWLDHTLRRNCHVTQVTESKTEETTELTGRRGR